MAEFLMPSLGADMEAGKLIEWEKKPGDAVHRGDVIAVVETQKGAIEIEVFEDGVLDEYLVEIGKKVPVGTALAMISAGDGAKHARVPEEQKPVLPPVHQPLQQSVQQPDNVTVRQSPSSRIRISPAARKLAQESGIDLAKVAGTGPNSEINLSDINALITPQAQSEAPPSKSTMPHTELDKMSGMRSAIAAAMSRSKREIPHYYLAQTIDLSKAESFVREHNANREPGDRLVLGVLYLKAVAMAIARFPEFNGHYVDDRFEPAASVHTGMAINIRGGGLVAPAIHNTQNLPLDELMKAMTDLVARVRAGRFRAGELSDSTITVSSLGERGVETLYGVIYPPQVAILGFGTPTQKVFNDNGDIAWHKCVVATLAGDHRVSDGHRGALFLNAIQNLLLLPENL